MITRFSVPNLHECTINLANIAANKVAPELVLTNAKVLSTYTDRIIDKKDFTSQTSQSSSKMLHGGIRYLEKLNFDLVWEALHEKNLWLGLSPHLC